LLSFDDTPSFATPPPQQAQAQVENALICKAFHAMLQAVTRAARVANVGNFRPVRAFCSGPSLWDRMGGEAKIKPFCNDLYDLHASDPLTAPWFGQNTPGYIRATEQVKQNVYEFVSAGIGGGAEYKGNDMKEAHKHMKIYKHTFHALTTHVFDMMAKHECGGVQEREEMYDILWSLRDDVMEASEKNMTPFPEPTDSLWNRLGGEEKIRPFCNDLYDLHASDPLTAPWFPGGKESAGNIRKSEETKENVFTFVSSGIGGPHEYKGRDMKEAHKHMKIPKHVFHALTNHVFRKMLEHKIGGDQEREEMHDILWSLRPDVMAGTEGENA